MTTRSALSTWRSLESGLRSSAVSTKASEVPFSSDTQRKVPGVKQKERKNTQVKIKSRIIHHFFHKAIKMEVYYEGLLLLLGL